MRGVHVAVDVGFDHAVHGDQAHASDQLGVVADLLRAQHDALFVEIDAVVEVLHCGGAQRQGRGRGAGQLARAQHVQHAVLQHFGVGGEVFERPGVQAGQHGIGNVAHARLQRQQVSGQAAQLHFLLQEIDDVAGNAVGSVVRRGVHRVAVGLVGFDHRNHPGGVTAQVGFANALVRLRHLDGPPVGRNICAVVDVVHALQTRVVPGVHFQNDLVRLVEPGLVVAHGRGRNQAPVGQHPRHFHHRHVQLAQKAEPHKLGHVRQVDVHVLHLPGIDLLAAGGVGLVG